MKDKGKMRWTFRVYLQWPLYLTVFMVLLAAAVGAVSLTAGIIVSAFTLVYIGIVALLFQKKGNPGRTDRICGSLRSEQAGYPERNAGSLCSDRPDGASFVDEPRVFIDLRGR